ncbi:hypothetical protein NHX12_006646 [Muraenolepis orangiensis]|uniref:Secreted protein n=1 Tax=Muraenolepis orangiensis TaxID=630683 RepID=A0A9Q0DRX5_9TELE|nr:hypothetical protein NHX12_006646 [Muraenolepis orangiensis]
MLGFLSTFVQAWLWLAGGSSLKTFHNDGGDGEVRSHLGERLRRDLTMVKEAPYLPSEWSGASCEVKRKTVKTCGPAGAEAMCPLPSPALPIPNPL